MAQSLHVFKRGTVQMALFLLLFSMLFTRMFTENSGLFLICAVVITAFNALVEYVLATKMGNNPQKYMHVFLAICLPFAIIVLTMYVVVF